MSGFRLAIDYGTSHTVGVLGWPDGRTRPLLFDSSPLLSSAVLAGQDGRLRTGTDAERHALLDPAGYEPYPKRRIDEGDVLLGGRSHPVADLVAATLGRVRSEATRTAGGRLDDVTLTFPTSWGPSRRRTLLAAAARAGLGEPTLVLEPVAAAHYFTAVLGHTLAAGSCLVVYDLGAGTFDVTVVTSGAGGFEPVAWRGLDTFGGADLDAVVVDAVGHTIAGDDADAWRRLTAPTTPGDRRHFWTLWTQARQAKETLSRHATAALYLPVLDRDAYVSRQELETAAKPLLEHTIRLTRSAIHDAGFTTDRVAGLFLVGGASRMPLVATLLHQRIGIPPTVLEQPELVVAEGALPTPASTPVTPGGAVPASTSSQPTAGPDEPPRAEAGRPATTRTRDRRGHRRWTTAAALALALLPALAADLPSDGQTRTGPTPSGHPPTASTSPAAPAPSATASKPTPTPVKTSQAAPNRRTSSPPTTSPSVRKSPTPAVLSGEYAMRLSHTGMCLGLGPELFKDTGRTVVGQHPCDSASPPTVLQPVGSAYHIVLDDPADVDCATVDFGGTESGRLLAGADCEASRADQRFTLEPVNTPAAGYRLRSVAGNRYCIGAYQASQEPGAQVIQTSCTGGRDQIFTITR